MILNIPKSVLKPSAQINKLLQVGDELGAGANDYGCKLAENKPTLGAYYYVFMIMVYGGTRIQETLNIGPGDITELGQVNIKASKGSDNRLVFAPQSVEYLLKAKTFGLEPFSSLNRFAAYRHLKRIGISTLKNGRVNESVTHALRNDYVKSARKVTETAKELSKLTGHKNPINTEFYGKD